MFPIQNGIKQDALSPLLFNFALEYANRKGQVNRVGIKLNETHQLLVYADAVLCLKILQLSLRKVQKLHSKHNTALPTDPKHKLIPYNSKPPPLHGLPKIHKHNIPLRPTVSSIGSPCYALAGFIHEILSPLAGKLASFVKNLGHFLQLLKSVNLLSLNILVSYNVVSLFTNVPIDEALQVIRNKLHNDDTLAERSVLQVKAIMELLEVCMLATHAWSILRNWLLTWQNTNKPSLWLWYVDDTFVVWPHGPQLLQNFLNYLNSLRPSRPFWIFWQSGKR
jgi:hypothetical protein